CGARRHGAALLALARPARRLGSPAVSVSHPSQIAPINTLCSPTPEEIGYAQRVVNAIEEANARGDGSIAFGGQLIARPIVERARRTLEMAKLLDIGAYAKGAGG